MSGRLFLAAAVLLTAGYTANADVWSLTDWSNTDGVYTISQTFDAGEGNYFDSFTIHSMDLTVTADGGDPVKTGSGNQSFYDVYLNYGLFPRDAMLGVDIVGYDAPSVSYDLFEGWDLSKSALNYGLGSAYTFDFVEGNYTDSLTLTLEFTIDTLNQGLADYSFTPSFWNGSALEFSFTTAQTQSPTPEPATMLIFGIGMAGAGIAAYRRRQK